MLALDVDAAYLGIVHRPWNNRCDPSSGMVAEVETEAWQVTTVRSDQMLRFLPCKRS